MGSTNFNQFTIDYYQVYLSISTGAIFISILFIFFTMASARASGSCKGTVNRDFLLPGLGPGSSEGGVPGVRYPRRQPKRAPKGALFGENATRKGNDREFTPQAQGATVTALTWASSSFSSSIVPSMASTASRCSAAFQLSDFSFQFFSNSALVGPEEKEGVVEEKKSVAEEIQLRPGLLEPSLQQ